MKLWEKKDNYGIQNRNYDIKNSNYEIKKRLYGVHFYFLSHNYDLLWLLFSPSFPRSVTEIRKYTDSLSTELLLKENETFFSQERINNLPLVRGRQEVFQETGPLFHPL